MVTIMTGVTIMLIEKKVDSGPVLSQREIPVSAEDTTESLSERLAKLGAELLVKTLPAWIDGQDPTAFRRMKRRRATRGWKPRKTAGLTGSLPAVQLGRRVRAYYPWPGCFTDWKGMRLKIIKGGAG